MNARLYILAGANGSGKSTISRVLLPAESLVYVNPDDIARELNPSDPTAARVKAGGHYVPDEDVRRRYYRSKKNFLECYSKAADQWALYYNGSEGLVLVAYDDGKQHAVLSEALFNKFKEGVDNV